MKPRHILPARARRLDIPLVDLRIMVGSVESSGHVFIAEETTAPGGGPPLHIHKCQIEIFRILRGHYMFVAGDQRINGRAGEMVIVPAGTPHGFVNAGDQPASLQFMLTPAGHAEQSFRLLEDILKESAGPPDMARLNERMKPFDVEFVGPPLTLSDDI